MPSEAREGFDEIMQLYPIAATMDWRRYLIDSSSRADGREFRTPVYNHRIPECHLSIRDSLTFAATLQTQHFRLVTALRL